MSQQPDLAASIKQTRNRRSPAVDPRPEPETPAPIQVLRSSPKSGRQTDEPTRPLGTRVAQSVHAELNDYLDRINRLVRERGLKRFTQRELVELALRDLFERDPETLL